MKKKKYMEVDVKNVITSADELEIKKMAFCMQSLLHRRTRGETGWARPTPGAFNVHPIISKGC